MYIYKGMDPIFFIPCPGLANLINYVRCFHIILLFRAKNDSVVFPPRKEIFILSPNIAASLVSSPSTPICDVHREESNVKHKSPDRFR